MIGGLVDLTRDIVWSDLCVSAEPANCWYKETPDATKVPPVPETAWRDLHELWLLLESTWKKNGEHVARHGFIVNFNDVRLRAKRIPLANEQHVYVCRAFRFKPRRFTEIGLNPAVAARMMSPALRNGIGIILGRPGAGKTTTGTAYVQERARQIGGVTWSIENPVEIEMEGRYDDGYIHQRELETPDEVSDAIRDLARATPNVMFVGEVLDDGTAEAVVQASKAGFLVLCTYHGNDLINGIERFARSAGRGQISAQFVEAFRFAVHVDLRLAQGPAGAKAPADSLIGQMTSGHPPRVLHARALFCMDETDPIRGHMRKGDFHMLNSEIERQKAELLKELATLKAGRNPSLVAS